jgi:hypothetical protein
MIVVHHSYNKCTTPLHMGWAPHTVEPTPCEGVLYICCTLGVQESLPPFFLITYTYSYTCILFGAVLRWSKVFEFHSKILLEHGSLVNIIIYKTAMLKQNFRMKSGNFALAKYYPFVWLPFSSWVILQWSKISGNLPEILLLPSTALSSFVFCLNIIHLTLSFSHIGRQHFFLLLLNISFT